MLITNSTLKLFNPLFVAWYKRIPLSISLSHTFFLSHLDLAEMASAPTPCEEFVYMAKLVEQVKHYEEMVEFMEKVFASTESEELTVDERNLLSVAYKNMIGAHHTSWHIISSTE